MQPQFPKEFIAVAGGERAKGTGEERKGEGGFSGVRAKELDTGTHSRSRVEHRSPRMSHQRGPGAWRQWWIAEWEVKIRQQSRGVCGYPGDLDHRDRQRSMQEPSNQLPAYCHSAPPPAPAEPSRRGEVGKII